MATKAACPLDLHPVTSPCKCLPPVFHLTKPVSCELLPNACEQAKVPHYFQIAGIGGGTDSDGRDFWLLLNAWGNGWQQEGYFKVMRGTTELQITNYGAWGVDWTHAEA